MSAPTLGTLFDVLADWTWRTSLETSVLIGLVCVVQWLLGERLPVQARYVLSFLVLCRLVLPAAPASQVSVFNLARFSIPPADAVSTESAAPELAPSPSATTPSPPSSLAASPGDRAPGLSTAAAPSPTLLSLVWAAGFGLVLTAGLGRHWRFGRRIRRFGTGPDDGTRTLLEECQRQMRVTRPVGILVTDHCHVPALCGVLRPFLLLPRGVLALDPKELRLVLLHELAHLKRRDGLLNWCMIVLRAWHWFNPLVWMAMRRLRADRELVCDAMVLQGLDGSERRLYGRTLLKLLETLPGVDPSPVLVPVLSHQQIKRRIIMIAKFKQPRRLAWMLAAALIATVCCLTFSRAADPDAPPSAAPAARAADVAALPRHAKTAPTPAAIRRLEDRVREQDATVAKAQAAVDALRAELGNMSGPAEGDDGTSESIQALTREILAAAVQTAKHRALLDNLRNRKTEELRQLLPTAVPDALLTSMLDRLSTLETQHAQLSTEYSPEHPQMRAIAAAQKALNRQIEQRIHGILDGLSAQRAASEEISKRLGEQVLQLKVRDAEMTEKYRPYFLAKRELETQRRIQETLLLRLLQEKVDLELRESPETQ